jgi:hypothetical protein
MTASAHIVTVGAMPSPGTDGAAVAAALGAAGVSVVSRVFVEDDETALERALGSDEALTVVLAGGGGSAGDIVRRVLARVTGARLVLNDRLLTTLQERYRRLDRCRVAPSAWPFCLRALPCGSRPTPKPGGRWKAATGLSRCWRATPRCRRRSPSS